MTRERVPSPIDRQALAADLRTAGSTNSPVLITGSSGLGRLAARAIHEHANRHRTAQFVELKPGDIDETLASISPCLSTMCTVCHRRPNRR